MNFPICKVCPLIRTRRQILPSGPSPCRILFLGEAPSRNEDASGFPFDARGHAGMEFNEQYLPLAGLFREEVAVANPILCSQAGYRNPKPEEAQTCASCWLPGYIKQLNPEIIVPMGGVACSLFPGINLNIHHGIPQLSSYGDWMGIVLPSYHPAFGLRSTAAMIPLRADFKALGDLIRALDSGSFSWPQDPHPHPDYQVIRDIHGLNSYLPSGRHFWEISEDTENRLDGTPYCLTFSHTPGTGRLIYADNPRVLRAYNSYLHCFRPLMPFHNWLHDADVREKMGVDYTRITDTMIRAYEMCIGGGGDEEEGGSARGSLGLKTLAYRHLHMSMTSFKDTVRPHTIPHVIEYLQKGLALCSTVEKGEGEMCECGHESGMHEARGKTMRTTGACLCGDCPKWRKVKPIKQDKGLGLLNRKLTGLIRALQENKLDKDGNPPDPWKRVGEWHDWERGLLGDMLGPMPILDVANVPEPELLTYAARDPDATLRLHYFLNRYKIG